MSHPTPFSESNAILAAQESDPVEVRRILEGMYPGERRRLGRAAEFLLDCLAEFEARE